MQVRMITAFALIVLVFFSSGIIFSKDTNKCAPGFNKIINQSGYSCVGTCGPKNSKVTLDMGGKVQCSYLVNCPSGYNTEDKNGIIFCYRRLETCGAGEIPFKKGNSLCCQKAIDCQKGFNVFDGKISRPCDEFKLEKCTSCEKNEAVSDGNSCKFEIAKCEKGYTAKIFPQGIGCMKVIHQCEEGLMPKLSQGPVQNGSVEGFECSKK